MKLQAKLLTVALFSVLLGASFAARAYKVTVENPTKDRIYVILFYGAPIIGPTSKYLWMDPNTAFTFETGADCPRGLLGEHTKFDIMGTDMWGTWYGDLNGVALFAPVLCQDRSMKICNMPEGSKEKYSFCVK